MTSKPKPVDVLTTSVHDCIRLREEQLERLQILVYNRSDSELGAQRRKRIRDIINLLDLLRLSTVNVVETLVDWRRGKCFPFFYDNENYITRIPSDLDFLDNHPEVVALLETTFRRNPFIQRQNLDKHISSVLTDQVKWTRGTDGIDQSRINFAANVIIDEERMHGRHVLKRGVRIREKLKPAIFTANGSCHASLRTNSTEKTISRKNFRALLHRRKCSILPIELEWLLSRVSDDKGRVQVNKLLHFMNMKKNNNNEKNEKNVPRFQLSSNADKMPKYAIQQIDDEIILGEKNLNIIESKMLILNDKLNFIDSKPMIQLKIEKEGAKWRNTRLEARRDAINHEKSQLHVKKMRILKEDAELKNLRLQYIKELRRREEMVDVIMDNKRLGKEALSSALAKGRNAKEALERFRAHERKRKLKEARQAREYEKKELQEALLKEKKERAAARLRAWNYEKTLKNNKLLQSSTVRKPKKIATRSVNGFLLTAKADVKKSIRINAIDPRNHLVLTIRVPLHRAISILALRSLDNEEIYIDRQKLLDKVFIVPEVKDTPESRIRFPIKNQVAPKKEEEKKQMQIWAGHVHLGPFVVPCTATELPDGSGAFRITIKLPGEKKSSPFVLEAPGGNFTGSRWPNKDTLFSAIEMKWKIKNGKKVRILSKAHPMKQYALKCVITQCIIRDKIVYIRVHHYHEREVIVAPFDDSGCALQWFSVRISKFQNEPFWNSLSLVKLIKRLSWSADGSSLIFQKRWKKKFKIKGKYGLARSRIRIENVKETNNETFQFLLKQCRVISGVYGIVSVREGRSSLNGTEDQDEKENIWFDVSICVPKSGATLHAPCTADYLTLLLKNEKISEEKRLQYLSGKSPLEKENLINLVLSKLKVEKREDESIIAKVL
eukprot:g498.t1